MLEFVLIETVSCTVLPVYEDPCNHEPLSYAKGFSMAQAGFLSSFDDPFDHRTLANSEQLWSGQRVVLGKQLLLYCIARRMSECKLKLNILKEHQTFKIKTII